MSEGPYRVEAMKDAYSNMWHIVSCGDEVVYRYECGSDPIYAERFINGVYEKGHHAAIVHIVDEGNDAYKRGLVKGQAEGAEIATVMAYESGCDVGRKEYEKYRLAWEELNNTGTDSYDTAGCVFAEMDEIARKHGIAGGA